LPEKAGISYIRKHFQASATTFADFIERR